MAYVSSDSWRESNAHNFSGPHGLPFVIHLEEPLIYVLALMIHQLPVTQEE